MKEKNLDRLLFLCIGILISFFLVCLFAFIQINSEDIPEELNASVAESEQEIIDSCSSLNLTDTAICLRDAIKSFFKYNITEDDLILSFEEIKEYGGDCRNWAFLYEHLGESLGFNASTIRTEGIKGVLGAHRIAVMWDEFNYCRIDQLSVNCFNYEKH